MERIKRAVEIAKENRESFMPLQQSNLQDSIARGSVTEHVESLANIIFDKSFGQVVSLDRIDLEASRIVAIDATSPHSRGFEMLRTQVALKMRNAGHQTLGITSPTPGCGKTVCAVNLAFSLSRLTDRTVTLVDLDMRKPKVADYIGVPRGAGIESVINGRVTLEEVTIIPESGQGRFRIIPCSGSIRSVAEVISSLDMANLVDRLRVQDPNGLVVFDLPPILIVDDVVSFMPQLDAILLIVAAGQTTKSDIKSSQRLLDPRKILGVVLNKSEEEPDQNYYYGKD